MTVMEKFKGVFPPLVTPLDSNGKVDERALRKLVSRTLDGGVNGLVVLGTAGEGPVISLDERMRAIEITVDEVGGRVPVVAGTGDVNTQAVKRNNEMAARLGVSGSLVIPPFYFPQSQQAMIDFFGEIGESSTFPVFIYNFPQISKIYLEPPTVGLLSKEKNIAGVKDSSGNFISFLACLPFQSDSFVVYQGVGLLIAASLMQGCAGFISPVGNIDPALEVRLYREMMDGNVKKAMEIQGDVNKIINLWRGNASAPAPSIMKAVLELMGVIHSYPCSPNPKITGQPLEKLRAELEKLGLAQ